jgi:hypothetical protein
MKTPIKWIAEHAWKAPEQKALKVAIEKHPHAVRATKKQCLELITLKKLPLYIKRVGQRDWLFSPQEIRPIRKIISWTELLVFLNEQ